MLQITNEQYKWINDQIAKGQSKESIAKSLGMSSSTLLRKMREIELYGKTSAYDGRRSIASIKFKRLNAQRIARQLGYSDEIIEMIKVARNDNEISRALTTGRNQL